MRDAFCGATVETRVLRRGIVSHFRASARGRAKTMALLSTAEGRPLALLREVVLVAIRGYFAHLRAPQPPDERGPKAYRLIKGLFVLVTVYVKQILQNAAPVQR